MNHTGRFSTLATVGLMIAGCGGGGGSTTPAMLLLSQSSLAFKAPFGGQNPAAATVNVSVSGTATMTSFSATSDSPWLSVTPGSGTAPSTIQVSVALGTLTSASYTGNVTVTAPGAQGSPAMVTVTFTVGGPGPANTPFWSQWGANPQHTGAANVAGQTLAHQLADIVYDKFATAEAAENEPSAGENALLVHYQAPLTDGNDVYMMTKTGTYTSCTPVGSWTTGAACGPNTWNTMVWNVTRFTWENGQLIKIWSYATDWKPEPAGSVDTGLGLFGWEPVFHAVEANNFIYAPGAAGTIWKINKTDGTSTWAINPFSGVSINAANTYVSGPLTADSQGNIYYNVVELGDSSNGDPWAGQDVQGAWLVKVTPGDSPSIVTYAALLPSAPAGSATNCPSQFSDPGTLPWPPSVDAVAPTTLCGSQRPPINVAPAAAPDGTIYVVSRAHFDPAQDYLIAVNPNLTAKWVASLQLLLHDGCGVDIPISGPSNTDPNSCRNGTTVGVDPTTNAPGSGSVIDVPSSSPVVLPDGAILFAASTNYGIGHLFKFDSHGNFLTSYDYGWDTTPMVYQHNNTYSIVTKDQRPNSPLYCSFKDNPFCAPLPQPSAYYITQLDADLKTEWRFLSTNTESCQRNADGSISCVSDHPDGFEWCTNAGAVDKNGTVYVNSEDGNLYAIPQGNSGIFTAGVASLFLNESLGAAYTPLSIGPEGRLYTQNNGHLFVVGN